MDKNISTEDKIRLDRKKRETRRKIRSIIIWIIVLALIGSGVYLYNFYKANTRLPWQAPAAPVEVKTIEAKVELKSYSVAVDISGSVVPYDTQEVKFKSSGTVTSVLVQEGDKVVKGQLLATMDDSEVQYRIESAKNQIEVDKIDGNANQLRLDEMNLDTLMKQLDNTKLYANFDGVVTSVNVAENDYFEAGKAVITIIDNSRLKATVEIDEIDIQNISEGMKASVTSDSVPGKTMEAVVDYIPMVGRYTTSGIGVMDVDIVFDDFPESFKPGFSFEGIINVSEPMTMLLVPQNAVTTNRGVSTVQKKLADGTTQVITVQVKYLGEGYYQVISGDLADQDTVVMKSTNNDLASMMGGGMGGGMGGVMASPGADMGGGRPDR